MTREECIEACERSIDAEYLREALSASLDREATLLGYGPRLFDMAQLRDKTLEEAARECASEASRLRSIDGYAETAADGADLAAERIRSLKSPGAR